MRKVQVLIQVNLFADQATNDENDNITVYADANSIWEAVCAAFYELLTALQLQGRKLPSFGVREHSEGKDGFNYS